MDIRPDSATVPPATTAWTTRLFRYARRAFAIACFLYAAVQSRGWERISLVLMAGAVLAIELFKPQTESRAKNRLEGDLESRLAALYPYLEVSDSGITYEAQKGNYETALWDEIAGVAVFRNLSMDDLPLGAEWRILKSNQHVLRIEDWRNQDRKKLLQGFQKHLPGFASEEAERCFKSYDPGQWDCFTRETKSNS